MGMNDFILNCERDNNDLRKNIEYYKNKTQRLQQETQQLKHILDESEKWLEEESKLKGSETAYLYYGKVLNKIKELRGRENEQGK